MKKQTKQKNLRPDKDICLRCKSHSQCCAEDGQEEYLCPKILHPQIFDDNGKLIG